MKTLLSGSVGLLLGSVVLNAATSRADGPDSAALRIETARLRDDCLADVRTLADWEAQRGERRRELFEMLGLWPLPVRSPLQPTVTGRNNSADYTVEKLHFQSLPGLYVTANLYLPRDRQGPVPAILYACGHSLVKSNGVSFGNKVGYQHHGIWFARQGYACLVIDTLQLGEIEGMHHGTYREAQWWWNSRGYTPAGVEAWNCIRAVDYLETRPEIDARRIGMTGRSGGGSYTWTTAALDDRIRVAAPVAGITDLQNQVIDGCVEGHCDCMFFVNTYRWDFPLVAALIAPRPLLIVNTDSDPIFPLDGVGRLHAVTRRIYNLYGAGTNLGLVIGPGPHHDTQDLQVPVVRWFNQRLTGRDPLIEIAARREFAPAELRVFRDLPPDQVNTRIQEIFVPATPTPESVTREDLARHSLRGWPEPGPLFIATLNAGEVDGHRRQNWRFTSQPGLDLPMRVLFPRAGSETRKAVLRVVDAAGWKTAQTNPPPSEPGAETLLAIFAPRAVELEAAAQNPAQLRTWTQLRRRYQLLGQTVDTMRAWDIRRAVQAIHERVGAGVPIEIQGAGHLAVDALLAGIHEPAVTLRLTRLPADLRAGPDFLNLRKVADLAGLLNLARKHTTVLLDP